MISSSSFFNPAATLVLVAFVAKSLEITWKDGNFLLFCFDLGAISFCIKIFKFLSGRLGWFCSSLLNSEPFNHPFKRDPSLSSKFQDTVCWIMTACFPWMCVHACACIFKFQSFSTFLMTTFLRFAFLFMLCSWMCSVGSFSFIQPWLAMNYIFWVTLVGGFFLISHLLKLSIILSFDLSIYFRW